MLSRLVPGAVLLSLAIAGCFLLGTLGWFMIGFGMMTDCTNNYSCTTSGCSPCGTAERWINAGGVAQWLLAGVAGVLLFRGVRDRRALRLVVSGAAVLALSVAVVVGTTWRASQSYCQPGTTGYDASYCSTG